MKNKAQQANDGSLGMESTLSNAKVGLPRWFSWRKLTILAFVVVIVVVIFIIFVVVVGFWHSLSLSSSSLLASSLIKTGYGPSIQPSTRRSDTPSYRDGCPMTRTMSNGADMLFEGEVGPSPMAKMVTKTPLGPCMRRCTQCCIHPLWDPGNKTCCGS